MREQMRIWLRRLRRRRPSIYEIEPDEILLDSTNLPDFDIHQLEGHLIRPISKGALITFGVVCLLVALIFLGRVWSLQIINGDTYAAQSEENRLDHTVIFADRGVIYDRNGIKLAWNNLGPDQELYRREYLESGLGHLLGYVSSPKKDAAGFYYQETYTGEDGVEKLFDASLAGENGKRIVETNARGAVESESVFNAPGSGASLSLTLDAELTQKLHGFIEERAEDSGFTGGAGVIIDVESGDIVALTSFPEFSPSRLSAGDEEAVYLYSSDERKPFLNRVISGLYTPGSIIKPFIAAAALEEGIIDPGTQILSTGALTLENPYHPGLVSVFKDWKAHGYVDLRHALAVSSNVYFFEIGGGFSNQEGLGIARIEEYARRFGFGAPVGLNLATEPLGTIPNPAWKEEFFDDIWRIGDTYNTSIGQYGFQVTPLQAVRAVAAIANNGKLLTPSLTFGDATEKKELGFAPANLEIVREGMRLAVTEGTASGLFMPEVSVAAKTGTAELGSKKQYVNSWVIGFFPYERPRYAFAVLMEHGPRSNTLGGVYVMRRLFEWMYANRPYYLEGLTAPRTARSESQH